MKLLGELGQRESDIEICFYAQPFGVVPVDLAETYPLSQYDIEVPTDLETESFTVDAIVDFIQHQRFGKVVIHLGDTAEDTRTINLLSDAVNPDQLRIHSVCNPWSQQSFSALTSLLDDIK